MTIIDARNAIGERRGRNTPIVQDVRDCMEKNLPLRKIKTNGRFNWWRCELI